MEYSQTIINQKNLIKFQKLIRFDYIRLSYKRVKTVCVNIFNKLKSKKTWKIL